MDDSRDFPRSFAKQTARRQRDILRTVLRGAEASAGVTVQRVPGRSLFRILSPLLRARDDVERQGGDPNLVRAESTLPAGSSGDPLVREIFGFESTFRECLGKDVDMLASAEAVAREWEEKGDACHACLLLAWKHSFDENARRNATALVGASAVCRLALAYRFSLSDESLGARDKSVLKGGTSLGGLPIRDYARRNTLYVDTLCAKGGGGVGNVLVLNAIDYALRQGCTGVLAFSFSSRPVSPARPPESAKIFERLAFERVIPRAKFRTALYGSFYFKPLTSQGLSFVAGRDAPASIEFLRVCHRLGPTRSTSRRIVGRC